MVRRQCARLLAACGALCLLSLPAQAALHRVWAVDDGEKVFQDDLSHPLAAGPGNTVWDGHAVHLFGSRNEVVAFPLILEADGGRHPLLPPNDYRGMGVELFTEHYLNTPTDFWAYKHVEKIRELGLTTAYDDGLYHPEYPCTRDQMAVFIARAFLGV